MQASAADEAPQEAAKGENPWFIAAAVMFATFMEVLDTSIAAVALPYIAGSLSASNDEATWVLTSYLVSNAIVLPASNWCSLKFGRKRFLMSCVAIFTVASFLCGSAPTLAFMLAARVIQGAGGGALQPLSQAILLESFPPKQRGAAMAVFAFGVVVAPVLGPTLGGWLTDTYSWRYAFYINIPIGLIALFMINRFVHDPDYIKNAKAKPFDSLGLAALVVWTGGLQVILDKGQEVDWFGAVWIRWAAAAAIAGFLYWCYRSWFVKDTLVDLKVFKDRNFAVGCLLIFLFGVGIYATTTVPAIVLPGAAWLHRVYGRHRGGSPRPGGGLRYAGHRRAFQQGRPALAAQLRLRTVCRHDLLFRRHHARYLPDHPAHPHSAHRLLRLALFFVPISTAAYGTLDNTQIGNASGLFNLMRNVGGSIGISVAQTLLTRRSAAHQNDIINSVPMTGYGYQSAVSSAQHALGGYFGAANAGTATSGGPATSLLYQQLGQQALLWAFVDVFRWLSLMVGRLCGGSVAAQKGQTGQGSRGGALDLFTLQMESSFELVIPKGSAFASAPRWRTADPCWMTSNCPGSL